MLVFAEVLVDVPTVIEINTLTLVMVCVAFVMLCSLIWVARKSIKTINRS